MNNNILNDINKLTEKYDISKHELKEILEKNSKKETNLKIQERVEKNKTLIGKCFYTITEPHCGLFPAMKKFFMVISNRSDNEYRVECLTFYEHPTYWFDYKAHLASFAGDYYLGHFDFESFQTESILAKNIRNTTEITKEEFDEHARQYLQELLDTKWYPDHYRFGGKLPTDNEWKEKEKTLYID